MARLKVSISLKNFKILKFFNLWALRVLGRRIFSRISSPVFFSSVLWEKCPDKSSRKIIGKILAKGFCRAKFWAKFPFWRGAVRGEVFREVCREVFHEVFGLVLLGHSERKNFSKNFSPKFPWPCTAELEKFQGKTSRRGSAGGSSPRKIL